MSPLLGDFGNHDHRCPRPTRHSRHLRTSPSPRPPRRATRDRPGTGHRPSRPIPRPAESRRATPLPAPHTYSPHQRASQTSRPTQRSPRSPQHANRQPIPHPARHLPRISNPAPLFPIQPRPSTALMDRWLDTPDSPLPGVRSAASPRAVACGPVAIGGDRLKHNLFRLTVPCERRRSQAACAHSNRDSQYARPIVQFGAAPLVRRGGVA